MGRILSDRRYNGESSQIQCHVSGKLGNNDEQATGLSHRQNRPVTAYIGTHTEGYDIYDPVPSRSDCCKLAALPIFANFTLLERDATRQEKATPLLARAKGQ